jgi:hypothetical protein
VLPGDRPFGPSLQFPSSSGNWPFVQFHFLAIPYIISGVEGCAPGYASLQSATRPMVVGAAGAPGKLAI